jgi:hypothetical protein
MRRHTRLLAVTGLRVPSDLWLNADCNHDTHVTFADIDPFVALIGTTCP